jgi:hypothetical protein
MVMNVSYRANTVPAESVKKDPLDATTTAVKKDPLDDTTTATDESEKVTASADNMTGDAAAMIEEIKGFVQGPQGYSPSKTEIERALEAQENTAAAGEKTEDPDTTKEVKPEADMLAGFFNRFEFISAFGGSEAEQSKREELRPAPKKGVVAQEMVRRMVVRKLTGRREASAVTIQACARRMIAKNQMKDIRIMAFEREQSVEVSAAPDFLDDLVVGDVKKEKKGGLRNLFRRKKKSKNDGDADGAPLLQNRDLQPTVDAPIEENKTKGNTFSPE